MPAKHYNQKLTHADIIGLIDSGRYFVDLGAGTISRTAYGKTRKDGTRREFQRPIFSYSGGKSYLKRTALNRDSEQWTEGCYQFVRLFASPKFIVIAVSHVVWIYGTRSAIPPTYEIHHRDLDPTNNSFDNLYCMHPDDHRKLHRQLKEELKDVPF